MIEEIEVPISESESYILFNKRFIFGDGRFVVMMGSVCDILDDGMPEPNCSMAVIYENSNVMNYSNYLYAEFQSAADACVHHFIDKYNCRIRNIA